jgi:hypothetical protein
MLQLPAPSIKMKINNNSGQILLEVLVAMAIAAAVVVLGSQLVYVSLLGNKNSEDINIAFGLGGETLTAINAVATENWNNIYSLTHGSSQYYPQKSAGKWALAAGAENISLNLVAYSRFFTVQNVCRNITTRAIAGISDSDGSATTCNDLSGSSLDPSTQKVNIFVTLTGAPVASVSAYLTRWRNKTCLQTSWSSAGGGVYDCPSAYYGSTDGNIITGANLHL